MGGDSNILAEVGQLWRPKRGSVVAMRNGERTESWGETGVFHATHEDMFRVLDCSTFIYRSHGRYLTISCLHLNDCTVAYYLPFGYEACFDDSWELIS